MMYTYKKHHSKEDWKSKLYEILSAYQKMSFYDLSKSKVSKETINRRRSVMIAFYQELRSKGYKIQDPLNLKTNHIQFMVDTWVEQGNGPSAISNKISIINTFLKFVGKNAMIKSPEEYVHHKSLVVRKRTNQNDKPCTQSKVDIEALIHRTEALDKFSCAQLKMIYAFGLSTTEAISICPHVSHVSENMLLISRGTKARRTRDIRIDTDLKREALQYAKSLCKNFKSNLCGPERNIYQERRRLYYILDKLGITKAALGITVNEIRDWKPV